MFFLRVANAQVTFTSAVRRGDANVSGRKADGSLAAPQGLWRMAAMVRPRKLNTGSKRPCALVFAPCGGTP